MKYPKKLKYTREHEWVLVEGSEATVGVTDYAQHELGEVVYVELPKVGETVTKDEEFGTVESVKAASPIYAPVSGDVLEVNADLAERPETVNDDPYGDAWLIRIEMSDPSELDDLMTAEEYKDFIAEEAEESGDADEDEDEDLVDDDED
jgi:glycine cleavage system H protein